MMRALVIALLLVALLLQLLGCVYAVKTVPKFVDKGDLVGVTTADRASDWWVRPGALCTPLGVLLATIAGVLSLFPELV